jgi:hypothetical protein
MMNKKNGARTNEVLTSFRNRINGDVVYTSNLYNSRFVDGAEYIMVFPKPVAFNIRRTNWMRKDSLEQVKT